MLILGYTTGVNHIKSSGLFQQRRYPFSTDVKGIDTMSKHTTRPSSEVKIEAGYCQCGCGQKTRVSRSNDKANGLIKGEPLRFIHGHNSWKESPGPALWVAIHGLAAPYGECQCGCGNEVNLATRNYRSGLQRGKPVRFLPGHWLTKPTLEAAFWSFLAPGEPDTCWEWKGCESGVEYGALRYRGVDFRAHRLSYQLHFGPIPDGMLVCHKCDNPPCCNPKHLFLGTQADNTHDSMAKGRRAPSPFLTRQPPRRKIKLTSAQALEIRELYQPNIIGLSRELAARFGVSTQTIWKIGTGQTWILLETVEQTLAEHFAALETEEDE